MLSMIAQNTSYFLLAIQEVAAPYSCHLDSHPEIILANEFNVLEKFQDFTKDPNEDIYSRRLRIFSEMHSTSKRRRRVVPQAVDVCISKIFSEGWQGKPVKSKGIDLFHNH